jgi:hypothetical protein
VALARSASSGQTTAPKEGRKAITVDITADLDDEYRSGFVCTFLDEALDPA